MNAPQLITAMTQAAFVAIFVVSLVRAIRRPLRSNVDAALFFGAVAAAILNGLILSLIGIKPGWIITGLEGGVVMSLPYLLLRLLNDFAGVRTWLMRLAELGLVLCVLGLLFLPRQRGVTIALVAYFATLAGYTGIRFGQSALRTRGVTRRRMLAVAGGSLLLGLAILTIGLQTALPGVSAWLTAAGTTLPLLSGLAYFVGFSPPAFLRRVWQGPEMTSFLRTVAASSAMSDVSQVTRTLEERVAAVVGADSASIALLDQRTGRLHFLTPAEDGGKEWGLDERLSQEVLADSRCRLVVEGNNERPAGQLPSAAVLVGPLIAGDATLGLLGAFSKRVPMFAEDDLDLFEVVAEQAALAIRSVQRNQELRHQAELLDLAHDAIVVRDLESYALTYWNRGAEVLYGWAPEEAIGHVSNDILQTQYPEPLEGIMSSFLRHGRWEGELIQTRKDGNEVVVSSRWALQRDQSGSPSGILGINTDVSERKQAMEALRTANAELEEASRHKSQFLANMSHELRTPLNAILGFSEILMDEQPGTYDADSRRRFLQMVNEGGHNLLALVNDILDLSKVEAGQMTLRPERVAIADMIGLVLETVRPLAATKEIDIRSEVDHSLFVIADSAKVRQMLLNLISNAIKFTPEKGSVVVSGHLQGEQVELAVADSGVGIAAEDLERIFVEFHQVDSGPARSQQGTGLGLALTKRFAELHGGSVRVESEVGKGSRFVISLPLEPATEQIEAGFEVENETFPDDGRPLVLVVEDHPPTALLICTQLRLGGYRTEVAKDGQEAFEKARRLQPVAVTLDILLPGIDGWDVLRALKNDESTQSLPVIVVTVVENEPLGRALGAIDYFVKPVESRTLLAKLESLTLMTKVAQRKVRVLAIDDEPPALDLIEKTLQPLGFQVIRASGGGEGIEIALSQLPDLILTDLQMPEISGFDVVVALRAEPATRATPILVLTAKDLTAADKAVLNHSVEAVLRKGSDASVDLVSWVNQVSGRGGGSEETS